MMSEEAKPAEEGKAEPPPVADAAEPNSQPPPNLDEDGSIFSLHRPKDFGDGLGSGVGNILKGALGGAALMVTAPVKGAYDGAKEGGVWGGAKGLGFGVVMGAVGGASMIAGGAMTGVYQIGRGIYHTPGAVQASMNDKDWDPEKKEWIIYDLKKEASEVLPMSEEEFLASLTKDASGKENPEGASGKEERKPARKVSDMEYYDLLGVPSNATSGEIKKAYYLKAKQNHPDRHPDDPEAQAKFQKIGHAYQVLSDDQLRANYDQGGQQGVEGAPKVDSATLFAMIFGSEKFVPIVGELKIATQMQMQAEEERGGTKLANFKQKKREIQCAMNLVVKIQPYFDCGEDAKTFSTQLMEEVNELSASPFGSTLLGTIGLAYQEAASSELSTMSSVSVSFTQATRYIGSGMSIASQGVSAALTAREVNNIQKAALAKSNGAAPSAPAEGAAAPAEGAAEVKLTPEEEALLKQKIEQLSSHMFSVMWTITELDIRSTLAKVCKKVIRDHSVDEVTRRKRCEALLVLAGTYLSRAGTTEAGLGDIKARMSQQMNAAAGAQKEQSTEAEAKQHQEAGASAPASNGAKSEYTSFDSKPSYSADTTLD